MQITPWFDANYKLFQRDMVLDFASFFITVWLTTNCKLPKNSAYLERGRDSFQIRKLCKGNCKHPWKTLTHLSLSFIIQCQGMEERMQVKFSNRENSIEIEVKTSYTFTLSAIKQNWMQQILKYNKIETFLLSFYYFCTQEYYWSCNG